MSVLWKCSFLAFGKESHFLQICFNRDILKAYTKQFSFPIPYLIFYHRHDFSHSQKCSLVYSTCFPNTEHSHYLYVVFLSTSRQIQNSQTRPRPLPYIAFTFNCSNHSKIQCHVINTTNSIVKTNT